MKPYSIPQTLVEAQFRMNALCTGSVPPPLSTPFNIPGAGGGSPKPQSGAR